MIFKQQTPKTVTATQQLNRHIKYLAVLVCLTLIAINFAYLIEDPEHLFQPDPDCTICQITSAHIIIDSTEITIPELGLLERFQEISFQAHVVSFHFSIITPRAPSIFHLLNFLQI